MKKLVFALLFGLGIGGASLVFATELPGTVPFTTPYNKTYSQVSVVPTSGGERIIYSNGVIYNRNGGIYCVNECTYYENGSPTEIASGYIGGTASQTITTIGVNDYWSQGTQLIAPNAPSSWVTVISEAITLPPIESSEVARIFGNILASFGALFGIVAVICSFKFGIKFIKKAVPNSH